MRPGGLVCFRDYGAYDLPMLRFPPSRRLADRTYARMDGTLARFFTVDEVRTMFREAGLVEEGAGGDGENIALLATLKSTRFIAAEHVTNPP